jgi:hypothetical protein
MKRPWPTKGALLRYGKNDKIKEEKMGLFAVDCSDFSLSY